MKATDLADKQKNMVDMTQGASMDAIINVTGGEAFENSELDISQTSGKRRNTKRSIFSDWFKTAQ